MIELWINGVKLDVSENINFPLTYRLADVKSPEKRKRSASKTIKLPGTRVNNNFFASAYDLHISDIYGDLVGFDFDPTLRYPAYARENGSLAFIGSANLMEVHRENGINEFHVVLFSSIANLIQQLGDVMVGELGWSAYDHVLSVANIQASWTPTLGQGYVYPLVDYGYTDDLLVYKTNELFPHIFIKEFVEKCFEYSQMSVDSDWLDEADTKKMIWGHGGGEKVQISSAEATSRRAHYTGDGSQSYSYPVPYDALLDQSSVTKFEFIQISDNSVMTVTQDVDPSAQFDESTGELVVFDSGSYKLRIQGDVDVTYGFSNPALADQQFSISVKVQWFRNFALVAERVETIVASSGGGPTTLSFDNTHPLECDAGDVVSGRFLIQSFASTSDDAIGETLDVSIDFNNTVDFDFTAINTELIDGDTVEISRFLPKMKAADLLKDVIMMNNLYMDDPDADGVVKMEPLTDFYFGTNDYDDWSHKLDRSMKMIIKPASNIEGKTYVWRFAEDRDYYKDTYYKKFGLDYGDREYDVPSTFKKGEKVFQMKTAMSCPVQIDGTDIIIPRIVKRDEASGVSSPHKGKPRIYFYNGLKGTTTWKLENSDTGAQTSFGTYPQAHHLNDLTTPTYDLMFRHPEEVFYIGTAYTTDNLVERNHLQFIRELTGRDSKLVTAYFHLRVSDLYEGFMRRWKNIDGVLYRVNEVKDYLMNGNEVTKVELIRIVEGNSRNKYTIGSPPITMPPFNGAGDGNPITTDFEVRAERTFYAVDPSVKDVTVTLNGEKASQPFTGLPKGKIFNIFKMSAAGKITLSASGGELIYVAGGGPPSATMVITGKFDAVQVIYDTDGGNFYVI